MEDSEDDGRVGGTRCHYQSFGTWARRRATWPYFPSHNALLYIPRDLGLDRASAAQLSRRFYAYGKPRVLLFDVVETHSGTHLHEGLTEANATRRVCYDRAH